MNEETVFTIGAFCLMVAIALWADRWLPAADRLPTHWNLKRNVDGTMPRKIALGFMPGLYAVAALFSAKLPLAGIPPAGTDFGHWWTTVHSIAGLSALFVWVQLLLIVVTARTLRR